MSSFAYINDLKLNLLKIWISVLPPLVAESRTDQQEGQPRTQVADPGQPELTLAGEHQQRRDPAARARLDVGVQTVADHQRAPGPDPLHRFPHQRLERLARHHRRRDARRRGGGAVAARARVVRVPRSPARAEASAFNCDRGACGTWGSPGG